jgi:hypothetical protein
MSRISFTSAILFLPLLVASCEPEDFDYTGCTCHHGSPIDGWDESKDTTTVNGKDSVDGFAVSVDTWGNDEKKDIHL